MFGSQDQELNIQSKSTSPEPKSVNLEIRNAATPRCLASGTLISLSSLEWVQGENDAAQVKDPE